MNGTQVTSQFLRMLEYVDYISIDIADGKGETESFLGYMPILASQFNKKFIARGIKSKEDYDRAVKFGMDYFQGTCIPNRVSLKAGYTDFGQNPFFRLTEAVMTDEPNYEKIVAIINGDASMRCAILRLVNSRAFTDSSHFEFTAVGFQNFFGMVTLRRIIYFLNDSRENSTEQENNAYDRLLKISLQRSIFCAELYRRINGVQGSPHDAYMIGMLSTWDCMTGIPVTEALNHLTVSDQIKAALLSGEGTLGQLYNLVLHYEKAEWKDVESIIKQLGISIDIIATIYLESIEEAVSNYDDLTTPVSSIGS